MTVFCTLCIWDCLFLATGKWYYAGYLYYIIWRNYVSWSGD